jgi:hypothetical protein
MGIGNWDVLNMNFLREAEIKHGRVAMLGFAGAPHVKYALLCGQIFLTRQRMLGFASAPHVKYALLCGQIFLTRQRMLGFAGAPHVKYALLCGQIFLTRQRMLGFASALPPSSNTLATLVAACWQHLSVHCGNSRNTAAAPPCLVVWFCECCAAPFVTLAALLATNGAAFGCFVCACVCVRGEVFGSMFCLGVVV